MSPLKLKPLYNGLRKPCRICGDMFKKKGRAETLCDRCYYLCKRKVIAGRLKV